MAARCILYVAALSHDYTAITAEDFDQMACQSAAEQLTTRSLEFQVQLLERFMQLNPGTHANAWRSNPPTTCSATAIVGPRGCCAALDFLWDWG